MPMIVPRPPQRRADLAQREEALIVLEGARAAALGAGHGLGPGSRPRPVARMAAHVGRHVDRCGDALDGVLEGEVQLCFHVDAALGAGSGSSAAGAAGATPAASEQPTEDVAQVADVVDTEGGAAPTAEAAGEATGHGAHGPDLVVLLASVGITEDVVGGADLFERLLVARVGIGMVLLGQLAVGARDLLGRGRARHTQGLVVVLLEPFTLRRHGVPSLAFAFVSRSNLRAKPTGRSGPVPATAGGVDQPRTVTIAGRRTAPFHRYPGRIT